MAEIRLFEILIAADDHRVLSANEEAWALVQNDVFAAVETFLTEETREAFLRRLADRDPGWFLARFVRRPEQPCLARVLPGGAENGAVIRLELTWLNTLMEHYRRASHLLNTYASLLALTEDTYYEYLPGEGSITLFGTDQSGFPKGTMPLASFRALLEDRCGPEGRGELESWLRHLREETPRFRLTIPSNLFNEDPEIHAVQVRGCMNRRREEDRSLTGLIHPLRARSAVDREVTYDALTGLMDKEHITRVAQDRIDRVRAQGTALAILDIDYFKHVNDRFGHQYGDEVLRRVAGIIETEIGENGVAGRIGGDEFLIVFHPVNSETELRAYLRSIKSVVLATMNQITVSAGAAIFPTDAGSCQDLFLVADYCLYLAKEKGRNRYVIHTAGKHPPLEEIRRRQADGGRSLIRGRDDLPPGDALVQMQYMVRYGKRPPLDSLLNEFAQRFNIPFISLWREADEALLTVAGREKKDVDALERVLRNRRLRDLWVPQVEQDGLCVVNHANMIREEHRALRDALLEQDLLSYILIPLTDAAGVRVMMIFASVHRNIFWNEQHYMYYRLFADLLCGYPME